MRKKLFYKRSTWMGPLIATLLIAACTLTPPPPVAPPVELPPVDFPSAEDLPSEEDLPDLPAPGDSPGGNGESGDPSLGEPKAISFQTGDGRELEGIYYPATYSPAPVVVLMHWAGGTMNDWDEIALWLQNAPEESAGYSTGFNATISRSLLQTETWMDPSWFPPMRPEDSFNVVVFNFGGFGNSVEGTNPEGFVQDALAAIAYASQLEGVDPHQISTLGASIGADGAADGCNEFNMSEMYTGTCVGAFSISPGNYLGQSYVEVVIALQENDPPAEVHCMAASGDELAAETCQSGSGSGDYFMTTVYEGSAHGMVLLAPDVVPNPLEVYQEFLESAHGIDVIPD